MLLPLKKEKMMKIIRQMTFYTEPSEVVVGDKINVKLTDGRKFTATAIHRNDERILFMFDECVAERPMNERGGTEGGYEGSDMRKWLNEELFKSLSKKVQKRLIENEDGDKLWLLSLAEVCGCDSDFNDCEGQLEYFKTRKNRVADYKGDCASWWLRDVVSAAFFAYVYSHGFCTCDGASGAIGVRPAFAIKA